MKSDGLKSIFVIGLMSGTSMDGINITLVKTNGQSLQRYNYNQIYSYSEKTNFLLKEVISSISIFLKDKDKIKKLDYLVTLDHYKAIKKFIAKFDIKPEIIGFHGQTIYHNAKKGISFQLGSPKELSDLLQIKVVGNLRRNDLKFGGQGAPIAPIYHRYLMENHSINLPSCFLNIGGVANLTYWDGELLLGFDTGPGNGLMDLYMQKKFNKPYDFNGQLARKGIPNEKIIKQFLNHKYFTKKSPKSLDKNTFKYLFKNIDKLQLKHEDAMSTLLQLTVKSIQVSLVNTPKKIKSIYVMGGGMNNKYLIESLRKIITQKIYSVKKLNLPGEMIEAELIAFISARTFYGLPSTFPETTGTSFPTVAGEVY